MTNSGEVMMDTASTDIDMSNQVTTIDASVVQSRISMSDSLMKENEVDEQPVFPKLSAMEAAGGGRVEYRRVRCPPHRYTPLRENWEQILMPLVEYLKLQVRLDDTYVDYVVGIINKKIYTHAKDAGCKLSSSSCCSWSQFNWQTHQEASLWQG
jgi:hypothetical protein